MKFMTLKVSTFASENEFLFDNVNWIIPYIRKKCYPNFQGSISARFLCLSKCVSMRFYCVCPGFYCPLTRTA